MNREQDSRHGEAVAYAWVLPIQCDEHGENGPTFYVQPEKPFANKELFAVFKTPPQSQSVRDAYEKAVAICDEFMQETFHAKGLKTLDAQPKSLILGMAVGAETCRDRIRALIEQSPPAQGGE